ncbi:MAG: protease modulator HflC [Nevskia sp.]|jgi:membrane protease subunit HflC|nr:protease modulator HflC [Nevskia sp.]
MNNRQSFIAVGVVIALLLVLNSVFIVDQRYSKVVLFEFGELQGSDYKPGLHFKLPFVQTVKKFDSRILTLDNQTETFLTIEKKNVEVDFFVKWRIDDIATYYRSTGGQDLVAEGRLATIINPGLRAEFGSRTIQQAVSGERGEIMSALVKTAADKVKELGIKLVDVRIKSINLPKGVSDSVYERMRAERTRTASDLRARGFEEAEKIRAEADRSAQITLADAYRDAEKLRGEGDAKTTELSAKAYGTDPEFYAFYRSLNAYRDAFKDQKDVLVLEPKGEFFKYFKQSEPGK